VEVKITANAKQRAAQRIPNLQEHLETAFRRSVSIGAPNYANHARLHCPTGALFFYKNRHRQKIVLTVIPARDIELNTNHLVKCSGCGLRYEGSDKVCPWCGCSETEKETKSQVCKMCGEEIEPGKGVFETYAVHKRCRDEMTELFQ